MLESLRRGRLFDVTHYEDGAERLRQIPGRRIIQKEAPQGRNLRGAFLEVVSFVQALFSLNCLVELHGNRCVRSEYRQRRQARIETR